MTPEQVEETIDAAIVGAWERMAVPGVWQAILAVADELRLGRTPGAKPCES